MHVFECVCMRKVSGRNYFKGGGGGGGSVKPMKILNWNFSDKKGAKL